MVQTAQSEVVDADCLFGLWPRGDLDCSLETVLRLLESAGISAAVVCSLCAALYHDLIGNRETLDTCATRPELIPAAALHLRRAVHPAREVAEIGAAGFRLLRLFREYEGWPMAYAPLESALRAAGDEGLPVMLAALAPGDLTALAQLLERAPASVIVTGVNVSHTPLITEAIAVGRDIPTLYFATSRVEGIDTLGRMAEELGADRLVFGTGMPFQYPSSGLNLVMHSELSGAERAAILSGNIRRLLCSGTD